MLTPAQRAFLEQKHFAVVGTVNADGSPHLAVMWYLLEGDDIVVNSAEGRVKDRNLAKDQRMSVMVADAYRWIRVSGRARIDHDQTVAHEDIRRLAARYYASEAKANEAMAATFGKQHRISYRLATRDAASEGF